MNMKQCIVFMTFVIAIVSHCKGISKESEEVENWLTSNIHEKEKVTKLQLYVRDIFSSPTPTLVTVAMANSTFNTPTLFGLFGILDDPIAAGPEPGSKIVGQAQGTLAWASMEKVALHMSLTLVFTSGKYNGSTINLIGTNSYPEKTRQVAVVGGTGDFLLARGVTIITTVTSNSSGDAVFSYAVFVVQPKAKVPRFSSIMSS